MAVHYVTTTVLAFDLLSYLSSILPYVSLEKRLQSRTEAPNMILQSFQNRGFPPSWLL